MSVCSRPSGSKSRRPSNNYIMPTNLYRADFRLTTSSTLQIKMSTSQIGAIAAARSTTTSLGIHMGCLTSGCTRDTWTPILSDTIWKPCIGFTQTIFACCRNLSSYQQKLLPKMATKTQSLSISSSGET